MYFSLVPTPGYDISYLETCGINEGEWELFSGDILETEGTEDTDRIGWDWGGANCSIEGKSLLKIGKNINVL